MERCDICSGVLRRGIAEWHYCCESCGTEQSRLIPAINSGAARIQPDEQTRSRGLAPLREEAYRRILTEMARIRQGSGGSLLEVGSAHGWFVRAARSQFDCVVGIEPDDAVRVAFDDPNVEIRAGYFPEKVTANERFDVVAFNDVFEHIPDARHVAGAVVAALKPGGIAVINLPVREGLIYRLAKGLHCLGLRGPFERMWQKDFPSPHLYYFSHGGLVRLFETSGCNVEHVIAMPTLRLRGLWARIRYGERRTTVAMLVYVCSVLALPLLSALPADVECFYFRKRSD